MTAVGLVASGAFLGALLSIHMTRTAGNVASLWIANAILIAALLTEPKRVWPWLISAFIVANAAANGVTGNSLLLSLGFGLVNATEAVIAAGLILHRCGAAPTFESLQQVLCFSGAAGLVGPTVGATLGAAVVAEVIGGEFRQVWPVWFRGDALGNLTLAPVLILMVDLCRRVRAQPVLNLWVLVGAAWPIALTAVVAAGVFAQSVAPIAFLVTPVALFATLRLGPTGSALSAAAIILIGGYATARGMGPMTLEAGGMPEHILVLQLFVVTVLTCTLPVAALRAERHTMAMKLRAAAEFDSLTGLHNRRALDERLDGIAARLRDGTHVGLLLVDLDGFKAVNDIHGHPEGDQLLIAVGARLRRALGERGTVYRLGGDEFALICELTPESLDVPQRVAGQIVKALSEPFENGGLVHHVGASVGIAVASGSGLARQVLLRRADSALYRAKQDGRGRFCVSGDADAPGPHTPWNTGSPELRLLA